MLAYTLNTYNLSAQLNALYNLQVRGNLTAERLLRDYPLALTLVNPNDLGAAKGAFVNAVDHYLLASEFIRGRPTNITRLFNYDPEAASDEARFRKTLTELKASLETPVILTQITNHTGQIIVELGAYFNGDVLIRSLLPSFVGNRILLGSLPDPTFSGAVLGLTTSDVEKILSRSVNTVSNFRPVAQPSAGGVELKLNAVDGQLYRIEVTEDLLSWSLIAVARATNGVLTYLDSDGFNQLNLRFYRARR